MGCGDDTDNDIDNDQGDPCAADDAACGNVFHNPPTTNGGSPTQIALPDAAHGGSTTGPITDRPVATPTPTFVSCSTQQPDPDQGIPQGYCVCSGSTFAQSTNADVTPVNRCAYTNPLPASTTSIKTLPVGPTTTESPPPTPTPPPPSNQISIFYDSGCDDTTCYETYYVYATDVGGTVDVCNYFFNGPDPIFQTDADDNNAYPTKLGPFDDGKVATKCTYTGDATKGAGTLSCAEFSKPAQCQNFASDGSSCTSCANGEGADSYCALIYCQF